MQTTIKRNELDSPGWYSRRLCVDATVEDASYGRLINHSQTDFNVRMKIVVVESKPRVVFIALHDIPVGTEIMYDYGERRKDVMRANPWLN